MKFSRKWNVYLALTAATMVGVVAAGSSSFYISWEDENVSEDGNVICSKEVNGDYFFVERNRDVIKTGSLLDVTGIGGKPKSFVVSWSFRDDKDRYLATNVPPEDIKNGYRKIDGSMYAENASYHHLYLENTKTMSISIQLKKYDSPEDIPKDKSLDEMAVRNIDLCVVNVGE